MNVLDLFSGIGGFSLGLERAGMKTVAFCEIDPTCRRVLKKHWPDVPVFEDVTALTKESLFVHGVPSSTYIDVICGGFPCQDISLAGKGAGLEGKRSGLWKEYARIVGEIQPKYAIIENVSALRSRGLVVVLQDLYALGYDAEWHCIPASAVGAPHQRDRIWVIAYPNSDSERFQEQSEPHSSASTWSQAGQLWRDADRLRDSLADTLRSRLERGAQAGSETGLEAGRTEPTGRGESRWATEPNVGRVAHGVPGRVDRLRQLGNAVVPQIPELIGRAIMKLEGLA